MNQKREPIDRPSVIQAIVDLSTRVHDRGSLQWPFDPGILHLMDDVELGRIWTYLQLVDRSQSSPL